MKVDQADKGRYSPLIPTCRLDQVRSMLKPASLDTRYDGRGRSEHCRRKSDCESSETSQFRFRKVRKVNQGSHLDRTASRPDRIRYHRYPPSRLREQ